MLRIRAADNEEAESKAGMLTESQVWRICELGILTFFIGAAAGGYMMLETGRWTAPAAIADYKRNPARSRLPIIAFYVCVPLGIATIFGAILIG